MPVSNQHDTFEILLFDASYRSSLELLSLLPETKRCIECEEASPEHRVQAAVIALKVASEIGAGAMDSVYEITEPLLANTTTNDPSRLEAEMVYHSIRGDGTRGIAAAATLVDMARRSNDPIRLARALTNAANSYRINGAFENAEACLNEVIEWCLQNHLIERAAITMQNLAKLNLAKGAIGRARELLERRKRLPRTGENLVAMTHQHVVGAWLAIKEGNAALASYEFSHLPKCSIGRESPGRRAAYLAVEIQVRLLEATCVPETLRPLATELEELHTKLWDMGLQDPEAESLYLALRAMGEPCRGQKLLREYLTMRRREIWPANRLLGLLPETSAGAAIDDTVIGEDTVLL